MSETVEEIRNAMGLPEEKTEEQQEEEKHMKAMRIVMGLPTDQVLDVPPEDEEIAVAMGVKKKKVSYTKEEAEMRRAMGLPT